MIDPALLEALKTALEGYRQAIARVRDQQEREDFLGTARIADAVIEAVKDGDLAKVRLEVGTFHRQVSDMFSKQPPEYRPLAEKISAIEKRVR